LKVLRGDWSLSDVPVIVVTNHSEAEFEVSALQLGASDFITKPYRAVAVIARVNTQLRTKRLSDELRHAATTDALTGLANRRSFDEYLAREWRRAGRAGDPVSLLMIDVDHFKLFNDHYGHPRGDVCLHQVADALAGACHRPADLVARYGGEEFAILLPQTPRAAAKLVLARILDGVKAAAIAHDRSPTAAHVTVSIGMACVDSVRGDGRCNDAQSTGLPDGLGMDTTGLIMAADEALYCAKRAGRARYHCGDLVDAG
jgi:diguanylate cyclase (GGDEF)-like protein